MVKQLCISPVMQYRKDPSIHIHMHVRRSVSKHMSTETGEQIRLPELLEHFDEFLSSYFFLARGGENMAA